MKSQISNFKARIPGWRSVHAHGRGGPNRRQLATGNRQLAWQLATGNSQLSRRGFTLIEVLVATLILGITVAAVSGVIKTGMRAWRTGHAASEIGQTARITQDVIMRDLDNIFYMSESSYNIVFRTQTAAFAGRYASQFKMNGDLRELQGAINKALNSRDRRAPRKERRRDDEGQRDAFADITLETISPPLNLSFKGGEERLTFARSYKARFSGDQDTWGLRRVTYFVKDKVLYRREDDPFGFRMPADAIDENTVFRRGETNNLDPLRIITEQVQRLFVVPEDDEDSQNGTESKPADAGGEAPAAHLLPSKLRIEEPLCSGVTLFKVKYGYFEKDQWVEDTNWDSQGRSHRSQKQEDLTRLTGKATPMDPVNIPANLLPPQFYARMNIPDDLPGYLSIQLGLCTPDGKGRVYSFTIYHSMPEAEEKDIPEEDEMHFGYNPNLPRL